MSHVWVPASQASTGRLTSEKKGEKKYFNSIQMCHVIQATSEIVTVSGNVQPPLTSAGLPIALKLVSIFTFTAEGSRMVVADGVGATDLRSLPALIDVW